MPLPLPRALPENAGFGFIGEQPWPSAALTSRTATRLLGLRNRHGKPNADVLRPVATAGRLARAAPRWQIDFPTDLSEAEAALFAEPFRLLAAAIPHRHARWWANPHANRTLRSALARRGRFLAADRDAARPDFHWLDAAVLPDSSLIVVARDEDFIRGLLQSPLFTLWWAQFPRRSRTIRVVHSFPLPWPPGAGLSALSATQEEQRHAVARAERSGRPSELHASVLRSYGWPEGSTEAGLLARLRELNLQRAGLPAPGAGRRAADGTRPRLD